MVSKVIKRLPDVKTLYDILPKGVEGGKEFARIVDLLLFHEGRRRGKKISIFSDVAGDYHGLDSFAGDAFRREGTTGYQYKFFPSPLSSEHRRKIEDSLKRTAENTKKLKLKKWILVTPQDLIESSTRNDGGDVTWFENLRIKFKLNFDLEHWGHKKLLALFLETPSLCLFYYPELIDMGIPRKKTIEDTRKRYNESLIKIYRDIQFVGMSVYKQEATKGIPMEHIYIPLTLMPETADEQSPDVQHINPLLLLESGSKSIILGDPGSGKSTLLRFLSLSGISRPLQERYRAKADKRLPVFITLRRYADELKSRINLSLIDYILENIQGHFNLKSADLDFFEYYMETGQAILLFDGLDELPSPHFKEILRERVLTLSTTYPGNTILVTSRIVGYDTPFRFDEKEFRHYRLTKLLLPEIEQFIKDWYRVRIQNKREREENVQDLIRILRDENNVAIRELAENPLLLTIVTLVHRIDAVLPDERVVLYQKCTETLLNTWHTWKFRDAEVKNRGKVERRNRHRMEAIAHWMQCRSVSAAKTQRAIVTYKDLSMFLTDHIAKQEKSYDPENDPEDLAKDFLEFIKKRAGLLIEVGDNQYSFVHLTFQEYLTASHIITISEMEGADGIWKRIKEYCNDPKWNEVIRLLVAGLKSDESQRFLINNIISERENFQQLTRSQLLGGLLLDGIEPAEERSEEILSQLILSGCLANDKDQLRSVISIIRIWLTKDDIKEDIISSAFQSLQKKISEEKQREVFSLIAACINLPEKIFVEITKDLLPGDGHFNDLFNLFLRKPSGVGSFDFLKPNFEFFFDVQNVFSLSSSFLIFFAAMGEAITYALGLHIHAKRIFELQLIVLSYGLHVGPFEHFILNVILISLDEKSHIYKWALVLALERVLAQALDQARDLARDLNLDLNLDRDRDRDRERERVLAQVLAQALDQARDLDRDLDLNRDLARARDLALARARARALDLDLDLALALDLDLDLTRMGNKTFWQEVISVPDLYGSILDLICDIFALNPRAQWWEALRVRFLPEIPARIKIFDESLWKQVDKKLQNRKIGETEIYIAACQIMFDVWLYIFGYYKSPDASIFKDLANLTREIDVPPLRIAHCIRDLAYGNESRTEDLISMVKSDEPEYRAIFERCLWRLTPEEEIRRTKNRKKIRKKKEK